MTVNIEVGKIKFLKNPPKIMYIPLGIRVVKILKFSLDKHFGDTANVKFGRLTASSRPLFGAPRLGYEKTTISVEFKYHSTQKASYRIKRGLITY